MNERGRKLGLVDRPELTRDDVNAVMIKLREKMTEQLNAKGKGAFVSRHEILGKVREEFREVDDAIRSPGIDNFALELLDLAVTCVIGLAGWDAGKTEL